MATRGAVFVLTSVEQETLVRLGPAGKSTEEVLTWLLAYYKRDLDTRDDNEEYDDIEF